MAKEQTAQWEQDEKQFLDRCMEAVASGDRAAYARLYERMSAAVYGFALSIVQERTDAEDVMQTVFLGIWDHAGQYRPGTDPKAWILKITRNQALMLLRRRKRTVVLEEYPEEAGGDEAASATDRLLLQTLLSRLDEMERQIVMLFAVEGYSHKEIASILGKPYATVRWKYSNAMKKLAKRLEEEERTAVSRAEASSSAEIRRFASL